MSTGYQRVNAIVFAKERIPFPFSVPFLCLPRPRRQRIWDHMLIVIVPVPVPGSGTGGFRVVAASRVRLLPPFLVRWTFIVFFTHLSINCNFLIQNKQQPKLFFVEKNKPDFESLKSAELRDLCENRFKFGMYRWISYLCFYSYLYYGITIIAFNWLNIELYQ